MGREADRAGILRGLGSQRRFYEPELRMKAGIEAGKIGRPAQGTLMAMGWRDEAYYRMDDWRGKWATEGGVIHGHLSHLGMRQQRNLSSASRILNFALLAIGLNSMVRAYSRPHDCTGILFHSAQAVLGTYVPYPERASVANSGANRLRHKTARQTASVHMSQLHQ